MRSKLAQKIVEDIMNDRDRIVLELLEKRDRGEELTYAEECMLDALIDSNSLDDIDDNNLSRPG